MHLTPTQKKDFIAVSIILGLMLGVNLGIYRYFTIEVGSNTYEIPDQTSPFYSQLVVIMALDRNFSYITYTLDLRNETNDLIVTTSIIFYEMRDNKYLYYVNFSSYPLENTAGIFYFYFEVRDWYSDPVRITQNMRFEWV